MILKDKVSIILLHYNQQKYIKEALGSVFDQKYKNIELIIADDATENFDVAEIKKYCKLCNKNNIHVIWQINDKNIGTVKSLNLAIKKATGEFVIIFAADDKLYSSDTVEDLVNAFRNESGNVAMIFGQCMMMDTGMKQLQYKFIDPKRGIEFNSFNSFKQFEVLSTECFIAMGASMTRMSALKKVGFFDEKYKYIEDWPIFLKFAKNDYKLHYCDIKTLLHRDGGISHRNQETKIQQYHIDFEKDLFDMIEKEIFPAFKKFNYKKKREIIELYNLRKNILRRYDVKIDDSKWSGLKKENLVFFMWLKVSFLMSTLKRKKEYLPKKIKVIFIAQYKQGCDKFASVVEAMKLDGDIEVKVLAVPYDINKFPENDEFEFWQNKFGEDIVINAVVNKKEWFNLKNKKPDYVFVQRPYDNYMPDGLRLCDVANYSKACYIPYGFTLCTTNDISLSEGTLRHVYMHFAENDIQREYAQKIFDGFDDSVLRRSVSVGYPLLDVVKEHAQKDGSAFDAMHNTFRVIWTPRWTTDVKNGISGTSFFKYKDKMVSFFKKNVHDQFVFRPHPLAFENFIKTGEMTASEVKKYLSNFNNVNMVYDKRDSYLNTFKNSDVLITDFSSIIMEYLFFDKPIIICEANTMVYNKIMIDISECMYKAENWKDVEKYINDLKNGIDPLKDKRRSVMEKYSKIYDGGVANRIIDEIKKDFRKEKK